MLVALVALVAGSVTGALALIGAALLALAPVLDSPVMLPDGWVFALAWFIPVVAAAASAPTASNGRRSLVAIAASAALAVWYVLTDDASGDTWRTLLGAFGSAVGTELLAYLVAWQHAHVNTKVLPRVALVR